MGLIGRIVVAVDFSDHSRHALKMAEEFAEKFGAKIELIHVFEMPIPPVAPYEFTMPDNFMAEARDSVLRELDGLKNEVAGHGIDVEAHLRDAPAYVAINELAAEVDADLIVMGTRGNTGLKHVLLGSVAERTLRHAHCPVLTVK